MAVFAGARLYDNNAQGTTTDNPLTNVATTVNSAGLANLSAVSGNHAVLVLDPLRAAGAPEIVIVTAHTGAATSATITRGAYGTSARQHASGTLWVHPATKDDLTRILTSGTRPADTYEGQLIYETDTDSFKAHNGTGWEQVVTLGGWTAYTPTLTQSGAVTKTVTYAKWRKVGRDLSGAFKLDATGAGTAANAVVVGLPEAIVPPANAVIGSGFIYDASANLFYPGTLRVASSTTVNFQPTDVVSALQLGAASFTAALAAGDIISGQFQTEAAA